MSVTNRAKKWKQLRLFVGPADKFIIASLECFFKIFFRANVNYSYLQYLLIIEKLLPKIKFKKYWKEFYPEHITCLIRLSYIFYHIQHVFSY